MQKFAQIPFLPRFCFEKAFLAKDFSHFRGRIFLGKEDCNMMCGKFTCGMVLGVAAGAAVGCTIWSWEEVPAGGGS